MARDKTKELRAIWSKGERDMMIHYPNGPDGHLLHQLISNENYVMLSKETGENMGLKYICGVDWNPYMALFQQKSFLKELEDRGYDVTTLKIFVKKKG